MRLRPFLSIVFIAVVALFGVVVLRTLVEEDPASSIRTDFDIQPDSTFHSIRTVFDERNGGVGAFATPDSYRVELWVYYGADGSVAAVRSETRDGESGALLQSSALVDGVIVATDASTGEVRTLQQFGNSRDLNQSIAAAQAQTAEALASGEFVADEEIEGRVLRVVDSPDSDGGKRRMYIDVGELRVVKSESIDARGMTIEVSETLVFEILVGRARGL